jgi:predicted HTH transcriptional regulator
MMSGGFSDPRNPHIAVMFALVGAAERAGSGVSYVAGVCRSLGMPLPSYYETSDPRSVLVSMSFGHPTVVRRCERGRPLASPMQARPIAV